MALPTPSPGVSLSLADVVTDDTVTIKVTRLVGRIVGTYKRALGGVKLVVYDEGVIEDRVLSTVLEPTAGLIDAGLYTGALFYNISTTSANEIGGSYEFFATVEVVTDTGAASARAALVRWAFQLDEQGGYSLDGDGRIPFAQVAVEEADIVTPSLGLARSFGWAIFDADTTVTAGDGIIGFVAPAWMDGWDITDVTASVAAPGTTGSMTLQLRRVRAGAHADVLSTKVTVASGVYTASNAVVDAAADDIETGDLFYLDRDAIHSTPASGLSVMVTARARA